LCLALHQEGSVPSGPTAFIAPARWYLMQACILPLLLVGLWRVLVLVTVWLVPPGPDLSMELARAYAGSIALGLVVPESIALLVGGPDALGRVAPFAGAMLLGFAWASVAMVLRRGRSLGWRSAIVRSLPGLVAQAVLGAPFLR
ncbi:MAG: hypothetical protein VX000_02540, partial [Myxococcota bacterium]|nr:hypothetical protein [Myxococcota bacterium]